MQDACEFFLRQVFQRHAVHRQGVGIDFVFDRRIAESAVHDVQQERGEYDDAHDGGSLENEQPRPAHAMTARQIGREAGRAQVDGVFVRARFHSYSSRKRLTMRWLRMFSPNVMKNSISPMAKMLL